MSVSPPAALAGLLLLFVLPGLATTFALFPEWRFRGPAAILRAVEVAALSLILSVSYTVLLGFVLLNSPSGFSAAWSSPTLELLLAAVTIVGFSVAIARGAFRRGAATLPRALEPSPGEEGGWEILRELESLARQERRLTHSVRVAETESDRKRSGDELARIRAEIRRIGEEREAEFVG